MGRILFLVILIASLTSIVLQLSQFGIHAHRLYVSSAQLRILKLAKDYIIAYSKDVDGDGDNEVYASAINESLPSTIKSAIESLQHEGYSQQIKYCTGSFDPLNPEFALKQGIFVSPNAIATLISPGSDGIFQTTCEDLVSKEDDVLVKIYQNDIKKTSKEIAGSVEIPGEGIRTINKHDNVDLHDSLVAIGNFSDLPTKDKFGNQIKSGTIVYLPGSTKYFCVFNGTAWSKYEVK